MEEEKIDLNGLIVIEQLPKITEHLEIISREIDVQIENALSLECSEENKQEVKKARANLNKVKTVLEERRKIVKDTINKPYKDFEEIYNKLVKEKLTDADNTLKERIEKIDNTEKEKKITELLSFATEYIEFYGLKDIIDPILFIPYTTLSKSQKSLKEQIKGEIERVSHEISVIKQEENSNELLMWYLEFNFDYARAKLEVMNRHKKIEELKIVAINDWQDNTDTVEPVEEEITIPVEIQEKLEEDLELESRKECTFTVWAYKDELIKIRNFLRDLGVKYE